VGDRRNVETWNFRVTVLPNKEEKGKTGKGRGNE